MDPIFFKRVDGSTRFGWVSRTQPDRAVLRVNMLTSGRHAGHLAGTHVRRTPTSTRSGCYTVDALTSILHAQRGRLAAVKAAKLIERCSDGGEDQGAEEALWAIENRFRQFWKPFPV